MSRTLRLLAGALCAAALFGLRGGIAAPAALAGDPCYHGFEQPALTVAAGTDVEALPCAFAPTITTVPAGTSVTFHNGNGPAHLVTGANQAWGDRDITLPSNASVTYTFTEPGVYPYACALHPGMSGAIVVGDGGPALATAIGTSTGAADAGAADEAAQAAAAATATTATAGPDPALVVVALAGAGALVAALAFLVLRRRMVTATPEPTA